jgi:hypothetical protein
MSERRCQLVVCVMSGRNEDELKQLKAYIKDCGTIKYGKLLSTIENKLMTYYDVTIRCNDTMCCSFKNCR